jgi:ssDNA-binding Zn-finger/Zn-ribbon topoisomerase 1
LSPSPHDPKAIAFSIEQGVAVSSVIARKKREVTILFLTSDGIRGASCPVCQDQMMLTNIKPSRFGFDLRTFKCDNCNHTEKLAIETNAKRRRSGAL